MLAGGLTAVQRIICRRLTAFANDSTTSEWTRLKELPKSATLGHLKELKERLDWLMTLGDVETHLAIIPGLNLLMK